MRENCTSGSTRGSVGNGVARNSARHSLLYCLRSASVVKFPDSQPQTRSKRWKSWCENKKWTISSARNTKSRKRLQPLAERCQATTSR